MEKLIYDDWFKFSDDKAKLNPIEDLKEYILGQIEKNKDKNLTISIGTDALIHSVSGNKLKGKEKFKESKKERVISYLTVIVFSSGNNGSHVIIRREKQKHTGFVPTVIKLNGEINLTSKLALWIEEVIGIKVQIHLDLNPKKNTGSFEVYSYINGYFESLGFITFYKPNSGAATSAADYFL